MIQNSLRAVLEFLLFCQERTVHNKSQISTCKHFHMPWYPSPRKTWQLRALNRKSVGGGGVASCWFCHCKATPELPKFLLSLETNIKNCGDTSLTKPRQAHTNLTQPNVIRHSACTLWWRMFAYFVPAWHDAATPKRLHHHHIKTCIIDKKINLSKGRNSCILQPQPDICATSTS